MYSVIIVTIRNGEPVAKEPAEIPIVSAKVRVDLQISGGGQGKVKVEPNIPFPDHYSATPFSLLTVCQAGPHVRRSRRSGKPYVTPETEPTYVRSPGQMLSNSSCVRFVLVYQPCAFKISIEPGPDFVAVLSILHS